MTEAFRELKGKPTFWWMTLGASVVAFVGYGLVSFQAPFLQREHGIGVRDAALFYGAPLSFLAAVGTFMGGYVTEKLTRRSPTAAAWVPATGLLLAIPAYIGAFYASNLRIVFILWGVAAVCHYAYLGAQYNIGQGVVSARSRATAIAILLLSVSLIGNGIGPYFVGFFSDLFMSLQLSGGEFAGELTPGLCKHADSALSARQIALCDVASSTGLKQAISLTVCWFVVAAGCFLMSARTLKRDFVARLDTH
jgi:MFS family permease